MPGGGGHEPLHGVGVEAAEAEAAGAVDPAQVGQAAGQRLGDLVAGVAERADDSSRRGSPSGAGGAAAPASGRRPSAGRRARAASASVDVAASSTCERRRRTGGSARPRGRQPARPDARRRSVRRWRSSGDERGQAGGQLAGRRPTQGRHDGVERLHPGLVGQGQLGVARCRTARPRPSAWTRRANSTARRVLPAAGLAARSARCAPCRPPRRSMPWTGRPAPRCGRRTAGPPSRPTPAPSAAGRSGRRRAGDRAAHPTAHDVDRLVDVGERQPPERFVADRRPGRRPGPARAPLTTIWPGPRPPPEPVGGDDRRAEALVALPGHVTGGDPDRAGRRPFGSAVGQLLQRDGRPHGLRGGVEGGHDRPSDAGEPSTGMGADQLRDADDRHPVGGDDRQR